MSRTYRGSNGLLYGRRGGLSSKNDWKTLNTYFGRASSTSKPVDYSIPPKNPSGVLDGTGTPDYDSMAGYDIEMEQHVRFKYGDDDDCDPGWQ